MEKVFVRIGFSDLVIHKEDLDMSICVIDEQGQPLEVGTYTVGYELADGTECDEDGNKL